ncbi:plasmid mobilization protein [Caballeronia sordidicola]|uniref:plasmid mobilization protein n=1 Tax=Caballeronia sordidicola TaxID=196367 RepID=UPI0015C61859|nr:plasmid mobilization relaxosome protein MobC [Caballeronia sordidicola]
MKSRNSSVLSVQLGALKPQWESYCRSHGVSPSDATRQVIRKLVGPEPYAESLDNSISSDVLHAKKRIEIRLTWEEHRTVKRVATLAGFSINSWIASLARAQLTVQPQLGQHELEKLAESNTRLLAIGRNLNQIARALNAAPTEQTVYRVDVVEALSEAIKSHTAAVSAVIQSNVQRWSR